MKKNRKRKNKKDLLMEKIEQARKESLHQARIIEVIPAVVTVPPPPRIK